MYCISLGHSVHSDWQSKQSNKKTHQWKACLWPPWCQSITFRALPCVPQVLHTDELVIPMEAVMLGFGVMVVQIFSQELQDGRSAIDWLEMNLSCTSVHHFKLSRLVTDTALEMLYLLTILLSLVLLVLQCVTWPYNSLSMSLDYTRHATTQTVQKTYEMVEDKNYLKMLFNNWC